MGVLTRTAGWDLGGYYGTRVRGMGVVKISSCARLPSGGFTGHCGARSDNRKPVDGTDKLHETFEGS